MRNYVLRRLLLLIPIIIGVTLVTFFMFRLIPGDAVDLICGIQCTEKEKADIRHFYGLDRAWYVQYGEWLLNSAQGDFGTSFLSHLSVSSELKHRLPVTLELTGLTLLLSLLLGIPPGVYSAVRPGTPLDWIMRFTSILWLSIPSFYLGILIIVFGLRWFGWVPPQFSTGAFVSPFQNPWVNFQQFFLPSLVLAVGGAAVIMRVTRSSMLEVLRNDYVRTAWAKGLRERAVVWRHALRNAWIPVTTLLGLQVGGLLEGAVIMESLFNLNGLGKYALESIIRRDVFVVSSIALVFALINVSVNLSIDLAYAWLDPRIRYT